MKNVVYYFITIGKYFGIVMDEEHFFARCFILTKHILAYIIVTIGGL